MVEVVKFKGGSRIDGVLRKYEYKLKDATRASVGFLEGGKYPDGTSIPMVAALNEYGTHNQPPRPFFRRSINEERWAISLAAALKQHKSARAGLEQAALVVRGDIQQSIRDLTSPPLAESTIARKGFDKPLIDSGIMLNNVNYKVE